jgi:hypothetical protein
MPTHRQNTSGLCGLTIQGLLDQVTQQNAALVVESASAAAALEEQAITLADAVAVFCR